VMAECVDGEVAAMGRHGYRYPKADVTQSRFRTGASHRCRWTSMLPPRSTGVAGRGPSQFPWKALPLHVDSSMLLCERPRHLSG
jgi:hypothetical protein